MKKALGIVPALVPQYDGMGTLDIYADDQLLFSARALNRFPEDGEVISLIGQYREKTGR